MSDGVDLIVNGKPAHVRSDGTTPLLQVLRNELGLRSRTRVEAVDHLKTGVTSGAVNGTVNGVANGAAYSRPAVSNVQSNGT